MKHNITRCDDTYLCELIFSDRTLYLLRHSGMIGEILESMYIFTDNQWTALENWLDNDLARNIKEIATIVKDGIDAEAIYYEALEECADQDRDDFEIPAKYTKTGNPYLFTI